MDVGHQQELDAGSRFAFGENWRRFLERVDDHRIELAVASLREMLGREDLSGVRFLDVGSGSGLFSLAARRLGAVVSSFDFDPGSVACTRALRHRYLPDDAQWNVVQGSVLDRKFLSELGRWDVVYSWGVLHHTGEMWQALGNVDAVVAADGLLVLAIYNDQGRASARWLRIKQLYNYLPATMRGIVLMPSLARLWGPTFVRDLIRGRPLHTWRHYAQEGIRGMSPWHDLVDWVGGLPFEVAKPEALLDFYRARGFELTRLRTCGGGIGCNEFVFQRSKPTAGDR
jgi:2-polyprenyl-3-methyl-5-hydroxy-6-metoxy-1,4-benzoquinol methylase